MRRALPLSLILALSTAAACSGSTGGNGSGGGKSTDGAKSGTSAPSSAPARPGYDPPLHFDAGSAKAMPDAAIAGDMTGDGLIHHRPPIALNGSTVYVAAPNSLWLISAETGQPMAETVHPKNKSTLDSGAIGGMNDNPTNPPLVTESNGKPVVLATFPVEVAGHGTTPSHEAAELTAVDGVNGSVLWRTELAVPDQGGEESARVVGVHDGTAVVGVGNLMFGVDLTSHKQRWTHNGITPREIIGDVIIGDDDKSDNVGDIYGSVVALGIDNGDKKWQILRHSYELQVVPAAADSVLAIVSAATSDTTTSALIDSGGKVVTKVVGVPDSLDWTASSCAPGDASTLVCSGITTADEKFVFGIDTAGGKVSWRLPAGKRVAPTVTAAWHGVVYGFTDSGPVILDAKTGADKVDAPGAAPLLVNPHYGVGLGTDISAGAKAYRASG